jgi:hypothetical protein
VDDVRHFGPAFYADVLGSEFGVRVAVRCDGTPQFRSLQDEEVLPVEVTEGDEADLQAEWRRSDGDEGPEFDHAEENC